MRIDTVVVGRVLNTTKSYSKNTLAWSLKAIKPNYQTYRLNDLNLTSIFDDLKITNHDTSDFIGSNPNIAKALLTINDSFKSFKEDMQNRLETMDVNANQIEKPTRLPVEIVSDILQENKNYFHDLEVSSENLRKEIGLETGPNIGSGSKLSLYLKEKHGIEVKIVTINEDEKISEVLKEL